MDTTKKHIKPATAYRIPHKDLMHPIYLISLISLFAFLSACNKTDTHPVDGAKAALLHDYTGLDGCGWVIKLENGDVLEPANLGDFTIELKEGKKVWITYAELQDVASICMVGPIVRIEGIWER